MTFFNNMVHEIGVPFILFEVGKDGLGRLVCAPWASYMGDFWVTPGGSRGSL